MVVRPVRRGGDGFFVRQLQRLHASDDLVHVATDAGGIVERQHELVFGVDDEHRPDGQGQILIVGRAGIEHAERGGNLAVVVADDRELRREIKEP